MKNRQDQIGKPSIADWRDHSAGASRRRATPIPRGLPFDGSLHQFRREERERDRHIDLSNAAFVACSNLLDAGDGAGNDLTKPTPATRDRCDERGAGLCANGSTVVKRHRSWRDDLALPLHRHRRRAAGRVSRALPSGTQCCLRCRIDLWTWVVTSLGLLLVRQFFSSASSTGRPNDPSGHRHG
jgi:hypothetical protein